jgi:hypothetical protein
MRFFSGTLDLLDLRERQTIAGVNVAKVDKGKKRAWF